MTLQHQYSNTNSTERSANETAAKLEKSVKTNDSQSFNHMMKDVTDYRSNHCESQTKAYMSAVTKKLESDGTLPRVSLFDAKENFNKLDADHNGRLQKQEIKEASNKASNGLERISSLSSSTSRILATRPSGTYCGPRLS